MRVELREDGTAEHLLSNGARRVISMLDEVEGIRLTGRSETYRDPKRPLLGVAPPGSPARPIERRAEGHRLRAVVSPTSNEEVLRSLTEAWGAPARTGPALLSFSRSESGTMMRLVFDESVGAEVESELQTTNGITARIRSQYTPEGNGCRLVSQETRIMDQRGATRLTRTFERSNSRGGAR